MSRSASRESVPLVSIVVPTRGRPAELARFIESLEGTVASPESAELVLVVDSDDGLWRNLPRTRIAIKRREVRPGLSMGELNSEGYAIAEGQWIFLLNDDVVARTNGWDQSLREATRLFHDQICLIHVNDGIFRDKLCTFPIVSRTFCEIAGGICPKEYNRYRIDDHIYHLFNLLCFSGYHRIVYFEDLVFEHLNRALTHQGIRAYQPNSTIHAIDTEIFESYAPRRKEVALDLVDHIEGARLAQRRQTLAGRFAELHNSVALRRPEYVTRLSRVTSLPAAATRVTIGIVSANLRVEHARLCIDAVKRFTSNFDLVVLDNNRRPDFNHAREMNRILSICQTDLLVLMDDDVIVEAGWLDGMLRAMGPEVGVVTPLHKNKTGTLSYAGVILRPDDSGHHSHDYEVPSAPVSIQTLCSAIMLIDVRKCAHVRIDESYSKYFLDLDYGLRIWEAGYRVVQSPYSLVTHIGGATLEQGSKLSNELFERQRTRFVERWMHTGRWHRLLNSSAWCSDVHLRSLADFPKELEALLGAQSSCMTLEVFEQNLKALFKFAVPRPTLREWANVKVREAFGSLGPNRFEQDNQRQALLGGHFFEPVLVESGFHGLNVVLWEGEFYAFPEDEGKFEAVKARQAGYSRNYRADDLNTLKGAIASEIPPVATILRDSTAAHIVAPPGVCLVEEGYRGYNIVEYDQLYAIRQVDGPFNPKRSAAGGYLGLLSAPSIDKLKSAVDACEARLLEEGYKGFNLIQAEVVYGFPQCDGVFDVARARAGRYPQLVTAGTIEEARAKIDGERLLSKLRRVQARWQKRAVRLLAFAASKAPQPRASGGDESELRSPEVRERSWLARSPVRLVDENYQGFDIFEYEYKFFAVPRSLGPLMYEVFKFDGRLTRCLIGQSREEARTLVDRSTSALSAEAKRFVVFGENPKVDDELLCNFGEVCNVVRLVSRRSAGDPSHITVPVDDDADIGRYLLSSSGADLTSALKQRHFTDAIISWGTPADWRDNSLEVAAARLATVVRLTISNGDPREYIGEGAHRLAYNKAYLASLISRIPLPIGQRVLEVGCSDGMVCDLMAMLGARDVVGVDIMETAGCCFMRPGVRYITGDAHALPLESNSVDLAISVATFEHLRDPRKAFDEMIRVLSPGGHAYVQAGPLYHSPFGHHMFGYFDSYPWIHLRMTPKDIATHAAKTGVRERIEHDHGKSVEAYVRDMLNPQHINGLTLSKYGLKALAEQSDLSVLFCNVSHEGEDKLDPPIRKELAHFDIATLTEHGFEVLLRKNH